MKFDKKLYQGLKKITVCAGIEILKIYSTKSYCSSPQIAQSSSAVEQWAAHVPPCTDAAVLGVVHAPSGMYMPLVVHPAVHVRVLSVDTQMSVPC